MFIYRYPQAGTRYSIYYLNCPTTATSFSICTYARYSNYYHRSDVGLQCTNNSKVLNNTSVIMIIITMLHRIWSLAYTSAVCKLTTFLNCYRECCQIAVKHWTVRWSFIRTSGDFCEQHMGNCLWWWLWFSSCNNSMSTTRILRIYQLQLCGKLTKVKVGGKNTMCLVSVHTTARQVVSKKSKTTLTGQPWHHWTICFVGSR